MLGGLILLFVINIFLIAFKKILLTLHYESIHVSKKNHFLSHKRIPFIFHNAKEVLETVRLCQILTFLAIGALLIPLLQTLSDTLNLPFIQEHLFLSFLVLFLFISAILLLSSYLTLKTNIIDLSLEKIDGLLYFMIFLKKLFFPFTWTIRYIFLRILNIFKLQIAPKYSPLDSSLLLHGLGYSNISLSTELIKIIHNAIRLPEIDVSDVLIPRSQIQFLDLNDSIQLNIDKAKSSGHTRFPLCKDGLDKCLGIVHIKDVFLFQGELNKLELEKFQRQLIRFPENTPVEDALKKFLKFKIHMALVIDEYGTTVGLLTLEDILEELVGNIEDEFDQEDATIVPITKNTYKISGLASVHKLESIFGISFNNQNVSSFGGLISAELGRIPEKNERIDLFGWSIKITEVSRKRIISTIIRLPHPTNKDLNQ